jgi:subtilisin family serine protease
MNNKFFKGILCICLTGLLMLAVVPGFTQSNPKGVIAGKMLVKFKPEKVAVFKPKAKQLEAPLKPEQFKTGLFAFDAVASKYKAYSMHRLFPDAGKMEAKQHKYGLDLWYVVDVDASASVTNAVSDMNRSGDLQFAQPVYEKKLIRPTADVKPVALGKEPHTNGADIMNDPYFNKQWDLKNVGQQGGYNGADINVENAWKINAGKPNVIVAVVDMGVDYTHEDLAANMWVNEKEKNGDEGVDDDHNGYVDDVYGYNFADNTGHILIGDHGTHVAGTIAAVNNNGIGISGIAGGTGNGDGVRIMSTEIFGNSYNDPAGAIVYGANNGAVISQNSWGYTTPGIYDQSVFDAIDYFTKEAGRDVNGHQVGPMNGGLVIFAAGNDATDATWYPGYYKNAIAVGATSVFDNRSYYSNYGDWLDISAPGGEMYSANDPRGILSTLPGNQYGYYQGTSMACPHVSGVAALIVSQFGKPGFTNTDLKNRLFTTVSPFIAMDAAYRNLMGIGRVNAGKALEPDKAIPPSKITDLTGVSNTSNTIALAWTAPADEDNGKAETYLLYYSTKPIDSTKLDSAQSIIIDSAKNAGQKESFTISGLLSSTNYYVAIVAKDLWANKSYLSNIVKTKTPEGPQVEVNPPSLEINLDVSKQPAKSGGFSLLNTGLGAMTWNGNMVPVSSSWANTNGFNDTMKYVDGSSYPYYWIGDDQAVPFSAATRFNVPPGKAFNLTHVANFMQTEGITQPIYISVIRGGENPSKGTLLLKQAYNSTDDYGTLQTIHLDGMYQFEPGEWFWVVFEYHEDFYYAQGATDYADHPEYFLTSSNRGKTWATIANSYKPVAFFTFALSNEGPIGGVTLSPASGKLNGNSSEKLTVTANAANLRNGTYYWKAEIHSNDFNNPVLNVPVTLTVTGQKAVLTANQAITDFGNVFIGKSMEASVKLYNLGLGVLNSFTFTSNNHRFSVVSLPDQINPGDSADMVIRFTPSGTGLQTGNFIIKTNDDSLKVAGSGVGLNPPVMTLSALPVQIAAKVDSAGSNTLTISNKTGKYPLSYSFPDYAARVKAKKLGMLNQGNESFGQYVWIDSREAGGPMYSWTDISATGDDITQHLSGTKEGLQYYNLGFPMRVYNDTISGLYVTNQGLLTFADVAGFNTSVASLPAVNDAVKGCIAPLWLNIYDGGISAREDMRVYVKRAPGKFIVQYNDMVYYAPGFFGGIDDYGKASFQVILYNDGKVEVNYKSVSSATWPLYSIVGIESKDETKGFSIDPAVLSLEDNMTLWMVPVQPDFIEKVKPYTGVVPVGDSVNITITANAKGLADDVYNRNLILTTNDPFKERVDVPVKFTVTGISGLMQQTDSLNFGSVLNNSITKQEAIFLNTGSKAVTILQIQSSNPAFTADLNNNIVVPPLSELRVPVVFKPATTGNFSGAITLHTNNTTEADFSVMVIGTVTEAPSFSYSIKGGTSKTLNVGETATGSITLTNSGVADMHVALEHPQWMFVNGDSAGVKNELMQAKSYSVHKNIGDTAASFDWIELANGLGTHSMIRLDLLQTQQIQLPFEFPYYNKKYKSIYLWYRGSLLLSPDQELPGFRLTTPSPAEPNGMIAALYEALYPDHDQYTGKYFGDVYYYTDSNKLVVQYNRMIAYREFVEGLATFEIILYKDGRIKYQYKDGQTATWTTNPFVGIENEDGTDGESVYNQTLWYKDHSAIEFVPSKSYTVKAGGSVNVPITWSTQSMTDGSYSDKLVINTNDPLNASVHVPLQLTVNGSTLYTTTDTVNYGKVVAYETGSAWNTVSQKVSFTNTGAKPITINDITVSKPDFMMLEEYVEYPVIVGAGETKMYTLDFTPDTTFSNVLEQLTFVTDLNVPEVIVPVTGFVTQPPVASVDSEVVKVTVQKTGSVNRTVQLQNLPGKTGLDYNIEVMYRRPGITYLGVPVKQQSKETHNAFSISGADIPSNGIKLYGGNETFTDSIKYTYDNPSGPIYGMGFGTDAAFYATAHFKAGKNGFNLTHVSNMYKTDVMLDYKIKVVIKLGNDVSTATPVYEQNVTLAADTVGREIMVKLDSALLMYPNEDFWIEWQFAEGMKLPQMFHFVENDKTLDDIFYFISPGYPYYRVIYQPMRFYIAAYEETDITSGWLELSPVAGTVPEERAQPINLTINGAGMPTIDASARLIMKNNDPFNAAQSVMVNAHIDQPPYLTNHDTLMVNEGDTLNYKIPVVDFEKGTITVDLKNAPASAKIDTAAGENYFVFTPGYADSGLHTFTIQPMDDHGNQITDSLIVKVINTNRPPVGKKVNDIITYTGNVINLSLDTLFTEPDNEPMVFGFDGDTSSIAKVLVERNGSVRIVTEDTGRVTLHFTATDILGAKGIDTVILIIANNNPPVAHELPMQIIEVNQPATSLSLSTLFTDPEGDNLSYTVAIDSAQLATVTVDNGSLKLLGTQPSIAKVTVTARDGKNGATQNVFLLKVLNDKGDVVNEYNITIGPDPFKSSTNIRFQLGASKKMKIDVINMAGSIQTVLFDGTQQAGSHTMHVNLNNIAAGSYLVRFTIDGKQGVIQVAKL